MQFRVTAEEDRFIRRKAIEHGGDLSAYLRSRVLEDSPFDNEKKRGQGAIKAQNDAMKFMAYTCNLLFKMAEKSLTEEESSEVIKKSKEWLSKNGYSYESMS